MNQKSDRRSHTEALLILSLLAFVIILWGGSWFAVRYPGSPLFISSTEERAFLGETFGAINALFAGLASAGVIVAILLQREELKLQREELRLQRQEAVLSREELARTAEAQAKSAELLSEQLHLEWLKMQPRFAFKGSPGLNPTHDPPFLVGLEIQGQHVASLHIEDHPESSWYDIRVLREGLAPYCQINVRPCPQAGVPIKVRLRYSTTAGSRGEALCELHPGSGEPFELVQMIPRVAR